MNCLRLPALLLLFFALCSSLPAVAQQTISGKVIDQEAKTPLEGVTVAVKNSQTSTITNATGDFTIRVPSSESVLTFSYVGFAGYEIKAGTGTTMAISLFKLENKMEDVIVIGYGTKKRVNVQGAVSTIKAAEIEDISVANLPSALVKQGAWCVSKL